MQAATEISETPSPILSIPLGATDTRIVLQCRGCNRSFYTRADKPHRHCFDCYTAWKKKRFAPRPPKHDSNTEAVAGGTEERDGDDILLELARLTGSMPEQPHPTPPETPHPTPPESPHLTPAPEPPHPTPPKPPLLVDASSQTGLEAETYSGLELSVDWG